MCDRRKGERGFSCRLSAVLKVDGASRELQILDESDGGMGFYCPDVTGLVKGQTVELEIDGRGLLPAQICYVSDHPNGGHKLGLKFLSSTE